MAESFGLPECDTLAVDGISFEEGFITSEIEKLDLQLFADLKVLLLDVVDQDFMDWYCHFYKRIHGRDVLDAVKFERIG